MSSAAIRGTVHPAKCAEVGMVQYGLPSMVQWFNNGSIWFNIGIYPVLSDLTTGHLPSDKTGYSLVIGPLKHRDMENISEDLSPRFWGCEAFLNI